MSKQQTIEEMREALAAFERDGKVEGQYTYDANLDWWETSTPCWDFNGTRYRPCPPKPAAPRKPRECWIEEKQPGWLDHSQAYCAESVFVTSPSPECKLIHFREVLPDEPQPIDRTPWVAVGSAVLCDGEHLFHAESRNSARRAVDAHNRAIGLSSKEEEA